MDIMHSIFDDETIQRQTLNQAKKKALKNAAKKFIEQGALSLDIIASCLGLSVKEVEDIANNKDIVKEEDEEEEEERYITV